MPDPEAKPGTDRPSSRGAWIGASIVGVLAFGSFAFRLSSEPSFVDEWAYISQAYFADLWLGGRVNDPAWLTYPSYDLPPLPKYLVGVALHAHGDRIPGPEAAAAWYRDTSTRFGPTTMLVAARWPSVLLGAVGCVAVYALGIQIGDRRIGVLAALLLVANPLYRLLARRAMSDVVAESMILLALAAGLDAWRRLLAGDRGPRPWLTAACAGVFGGLAPLAKLNGALAMLIISAWALLAVILPGVGRGRKLAAMLAAVLSGVISIATFVMLNPFLTAQPRRVFSGEESAIARMGVLGRARYLATFRMSVSRNQQEGFWRDALTTPRDKLEAVVVQGFGRFGPFGPRHSDSTRRFELAQDWGAVAWIPCVAAGAGWALLRGRRQRSSGSPPAAWALLAQSAVALVIVTAYLPLAWDRYFLSLQAGSALLASGVIVAGLDRLARVLAPGPGGA